MQGQQNLQFLCDAIEIFKMWKLSGKTGLTNQTFMACIQSMQAMIGLVDHLTKQHSYLYILPGKFRPIRSKEGLGGIVKPMEAISICLSIS